MLKKVASGVEFKISRTSAFQRVSRSPKIRPETIIDPSPGIPFITFPPPTLPTPPHLKTASVDLKLAAKPTRSSNRACVMC